jgi:hypothetical protein
MLPSQRDGELCPPPSERLPELSELSPSELIITISAPTASDSIVDDFKKYVSLCHNAFRYLATDAGMPPKMEVIFSSDFEAQVVARSQARHPEEKYCAQRPLASVWGINLAQDDQWDHVVVVFNAAEWAKHTSRTPKEQLNEMAVIGHEMAHAPLARLRIASGRPWALDRRSNYPWVKAETMSLGLMDEYLADRTANALVGAFCTSSGPSGEQRRSCVWDSMGEGYSGSLYQYLNDAFIELTGSVQKYQLHLMTLDDMWGQVLTTTSHLFTMLIHAQAHADSVGLELLEHAAFKDLPMVRLYLADTLPPFLAAIRRKGPFCSPQDWKARDEEALLHGKNAVLEFWRRLGLTFRETTPSSELFHIDVASPLLQ